MEQGCYTALVTPFSSTGDLDRDGLEKLIDFQMENGITGILATGTTGESPTFKWKEHDLVVALTAKQTKGKCKCIAGTGSNNTEEAVEGTAHAIDEGVDAILMVDPYYNGPSSLEIRKEYYEVLARQFPQLDIIPYIIPGRTGAQMLPQDLAILARNCPNISSVKEATGNLDNMKLTRKLCGPDFNIISGDDALVFRIMTDPEIKACGSFSVMANIIPSSMVRLVSLINEGKTDEAMEIHEAIAPLLDLVVVTTEEESPFGPVACRARNPLPLKTMMQILGMPSGPCRKPLGRMTRKGYDTVVNTMKDVRAKHPEVFEPLHTFFGMDIDQRLANAGQYTDLWYDY